jgi:hypothetical protein
MRLAPRQGAAVRKMRVRLATWAFCNATDHPITPQPIDFERGAMSHY